MDTRWGDQYLLAIGEFIKGNMDTSKYFSMQMKLDFFIKNIPFEILVLGIIGLIIIAMDLKTRKLGFFVPFFLLSLPIFLTIVTIPLPETRYIINVWVLLAVFAAISLERLFMIISCRMKWDRRESMALLILLISIYSSFKIRDNYRSDILRINTRSLIFKEYSDTLLKYFPREALFLVGDKSWLVGQYLVPLARPKWQVVYSGWGWGGVEGIVNRIKEAQKNDIPVFIDPYEYGLWEYDDADKIASEFKGERLMGTFFELKPNDK